MTGRYTEPQGRGDDVRCVVDPTRIVHGPNGRPEVDQRVQDAVIRHFNNNLHAHLKNDYDKFFNDLSRLLGIKLALADYNALRRMAASSRRLPDLSVQKKPQTLPKVSSIRSDGTSEDYFGTGSRTTPDEVWQDRLATLPLAVGPDHYSDIDLFNVSETSVSLKTLEALRQSNPGRESFTIDEIYNKGYNFTYSQLIRGHLKRTYDDIARNSYLPNYLTVNTNHTQEADYRHHEVTYVGPDFEPMYLEAARQARKRYTQSMQQGLSNVEHHDAGRTFAQDGDPTRKRNRDTGDPSPADNLPVQPKRSRTAQSTALTGAGLMSGRRLPAVAASGPAAGGFHARSSSPTRQVQQPRANAANTFDELFSGLPTPDPEALERVLAHFGDPHHPAVPPHLPHVLDQDDSRFLTGSNPALTAAGQPSQPDIWQRTASEPLAVIHQPLVGPNTSDGDRSHWQVRRGTPGPNDSGMTADVQNQRREMMPFDPLMSATSSASGASNGNPLFPPSPVGETSNLLHAGSFGGAGPTQSVQQPRGAQQSPADLMPGQRSPDPLFDLGHEVYDDPYWSGWTNGLGEPPFHWNDPFRVPPQTPEPSLVQSPAPLYDPNLPGGSPQVEDHWMQRRTHSPGLG